MSSLSEVRRRVQNNSRTVWSLASELTPLVSSSVMFLVLVLVLPTETNGDFIAITAAATIITPIARVGATVVLLRDIGAGRAEQAAWDDAFNASLAGVTTTLVAWLALSGFLLPNIGFLPAVLIFAQQLGPMAFSELCNSFLVVKLDMRNALLVRVVFAAWRIAGLVLFVLVGSDDLALLGAVLLLSGLLGAAHNLYRIGRRSGVRTRLRKRPLAVLTKGIPDSISSTTGTVLDSVDKPILNNAGFRADNARYGVAMRLVGLAGVTTIALLRPFDNELFRAGARSVAEANRVMVRAVRLTLPVSLLAAGVLWVLAAALPHLLPSDYAESVDIIRWGVWMMPMRAIAFPFGNVLTAAGHRASRLVITAIAAGGNLIGNLIFIPNHSWHAAVATTLLAEGFLALASVVLCILYARSERPGTATKP